MHCFESERHYVANVIATVLEHLQALESECNTRAFWKAGLEGSNQVVINR